MGYTMIYANSSMNLHGIEIKNWPRTLGLHSFDKVILSKWLKLFIGIKYGKHYKYYTVLHGMLWWKGKLQYLNREVICWENNLWILERYIYVFS